MDTVRISKIQIDESGRLCIQPEAVEFQHIYRAGMQVNWDDHGKFLYSPQPREWAYDKWFSQMIEAVQDEYRRTLVLTEQTLWQDIEPSLKMRLVDLGAADDKAC